LIATFPLFTKLSLAHKPAIEAFTSKFDPYSDFNFTSLYSWDLDNSVEVSFLHGNLVIKVPDYITSEPTYSILGKNNIDQSFVALIETAKELKLVPQITVDSLKKNEAFLVEEDRDNFDYIYSVQKLSSLVGSEFKGKRKGINRFYREYGGSLFLNSIDIAHTEAIQDILKTFRTWAHERERANYEASRELAALERLLAANFTNLRAIGMGIAGEPVGFSIHEVINSEYAICHFHKSVLAYEDIDLYLTNYASKDLEAQGCTYVNWEQDLGIGGLRELKNSYRPSHFLKKYTVKRANR
jgi:uncharacterized protein